MLIISIIKVSIYPAKFVQFEGNLQVVILCTLKGVNPAGSVHFEEAYSVLWVLYDFKEPANSLHFEGVPPPKLLYLYKYG